MEFFILLCIELSIMFLGVVALGSFCFLVISLFDHRRINNEEACVHSGERASDKTEEL